MNEEKLPCFSSSRTAFRPWSIHGSTAKFDDHVDVSDGPHGSYSSREFTRSKPWMTEKIKMCKRKTRRPHVSSLSFLTLPVVKRTFLSRFVSCGLSWNGLVIEWNCRMFVNKTLWLPPILRDDENVSVDRRATTWSMLLAPVNFSAVPGKR